MISSPNFIITMDDSYRMHSRTAFQFFFTASTLADLYFLIVIQLFCFSRFSRIIFSHVIYYQFGESSNSRINGHSIAVMIFFSFFRITAAHPQSLRSIINRIIAMPLPLNSSIE